MKSLWGLALAIVTLASAAAPAQTITRVATFENFSEGQTFKPSFTDPLSGITFHDSTNPSGGFVIEYSSTEFGGGNFLNAGGYVPGDGNGWGSNFGFTADLASPADHVSLDITYSVGNTSTIILKGYDSVGDVVTEQAAPLGAPRPFTLGINSAQFSIQRFQVSVGSIGTGYDNISYTTVPEPTAVALFLGIGSLTALLRQSRQEKTVCGYAPQEKRGQDS